MTEPAMVAGPGMVPWAAAHARTVGRSGIPIGPSTSDHGGPTRPSGPPTVTARLRMTLTGHGDRVWSVAWRSRPDGTAQLATGTGGADHIVRIWDAETATCLLTLAAHAGAIYTVSWANRADGVPLLATGGDDGTVRIWDGNIGMCLRTLTGNASWVYAVAWLVGREGVPLLASGGGDRTVRIWDADTGACVRTLTGHTGPVYAVAWIVGREGVPLLASGGGEGTVRIWDADTGVCVRTLTGHTGPVRSAAWMLRPDGILLLATGSDDHTARIWDTNTGACVRTLTGHTGWVHSLEWLLRDGIVLLASGSYDNTARIWDDDTGTCLCTLEHPDDVETVTFNTGPDGQLLLATACDDHNARVWEIDVTPAAPTVTDSGGVAGQPRVVGELYGQVWSVAFVDHPDGRRLASGGEDGTVRMWDLDGTGRPEIWARHDGPVRSVTGAHIRSEEVLVSAGEDRVVRFGRSAGERVEQWGIATDAVWAVAVHEYPDGTLIAAPDDTAAVRVHEIPADPPIEVGYFGSWFANPILRGHAGRVLALAFGTDPGGVVVLASGGTDEIIRVWGPLDLSGTSEWYDASPMAVFSGHTGWVTSLAFAVDPHGRHLLASGSHDHTVRIWDPHGRTLLRTLAGHGAPVWSVAWVSLPDGGLVLASGGNDHLVRLWDPETGDQLTALEHPADVLSVAAAPAADGTPSIATGCGDGRIRLWALPDLRRPRAHERTVARAPLSPSDIVVEESLVALAGDGGTYWTVALATMPDGRTLLAADTFDGGRIWDADTGRAGPACGPADVRSVAWARSGGGAVLVTGSRDATVRMWDPATGTCLRTFAGHTGDIESVACTTRGDGTLLIASGSRDHTVRIWDAASGACLHTLAGHTNEVNSVAWATGPGSTLLLASGSNDASARIWDAGNGECLRVLRRDGRYVISVAWVTRPGGVRLLAAGGSGGIVRIWDPDTGAHLRALAGSTNTVWSVAWVTGFDGTQLLATGSGDSNGEDQTVRIWDAITGTCLHTITGYTKPVFSVAWAVRPDGTILLASGGGGGKVRLHTVTLAAPPPPPPAEQAPVTHRMRASAHGLVALGTCGLWPPLGLVDDLVALTGPEPVTLRDQRLAELAGHPGIGRLRALGWPAAARVGFAALLAADLPANPRFSPPPAAGPDDQRTSLIRALATPPAPAQPTPPALDALRAAAAMITPKAVALLTILGPDAVATDPSLPLRLRDRIPAMPPLDAGQAALVGDAHATRARDGQAAGVSAHVPGSIGVARRGPVTNLLPAQWALPDDLLRLRQARDELLYRVRAGTPTAPPEAVTMILDTTPPTFGPVEAVLRLAAHLVTVTLWRAGRHPTLVTMDRPTFTRPLTGPADLAAVWTSRTLDPPALGAAMATARAAAHPTIVVLTHHDLAWEHPLRPGPRLRLLTTHVPGFPPPCPPAEDLHHRHLAPRPTAADLADAVSWLLAPVADQVGVPG